MLTRRSLVGSLAAAAALASLPRVGRASDPPMIIVFVSDGSPRIASVVRGFKAGLGEAMTMRFDCSGDTDAGAFIADNLEGVTVAGVFAVGDVALRVALREFNQTPVVWADALNNSAASLHPHQRGVSPRLDPTAVFARFKTLKPDLKSVGVLRSASDTDPYWEAVGAAATAAGLHLEVPAVGGSAEVANAFQRLISAADLTWIQADSTLWTGAVLAGLFHDAALAHHPVVGFDRAQLQGAQRPPLVLEADLEAMGRAAAELSNSLLTNTPPPELQRFAAPVMIGNMLALRQAGVLVNKKSAAAVDTWVD